jgi:hypothetical protein
MISPNQSDRRIVAMEASIGSICAIWNAADREGVLAAFRSLGPGGLTIEYVGSDPIDGQAAIDAMWDQ